MYSLGFYFLIAAALVCLTARWIGAVTALKLNLLFVFLSLLVAILILYESLLGVVTEIKIFSWIMVTDLFVDFGFFYDFLSASMFFLVIFISFFVHVFSYGYMEEDPSRVRFFCYLSLFSTFMGLLVVSDSLIQLFFAWEGVGISSYLLINFWYTRYEANRAAMKAVFVNRLGDFGLYSGIILFIVFFKTQSISSLNCLAYKLDEHHVFLDFFGFRCDLLTFISFFIFLGIVGKSAQLGLHTWLPDAMEGPTPVSALLHAATMVTAGIYVLLRLSFFFQVSNLMTFIAFWGALTALVASTIGAFQNDIKKIIAYSTCSQLGYMLAACGLYNFAGAYFHLFNHAFFKALLFLGAGSIIHALGDEQDLRKFGGLLTMLPLTHIALLIGSFSLMGVPFFSGFYSKDIIINWAFVYQNHWGRVIYFLLLFAAFFTAFYSIKILYYVFYSKPRFSRVLFTRITESNIWIKFPIVFLSVFAISSGYVFIDIFMGYGSVLAAFSLPIDFNHNYPLLTEGLSQKRKFFSLVLVSLSIFFFVFVVRKFFVFFFKAFDNYDQLYIYVRLQTFFNKKWYFDYFYYFVVKRLLFFSYNMLFKNFDKGIFERTFVKNTIWLTLSWANKVSFFRSGLLTDYFMFFFLVLFVLLVVWFFILTGVTELLILFLFYLFYLIWKK